MNISTTHMNDRLFRFFERFVFGGRWVIAPMYIGLLVALVIYTYKFLEQLAELVRHVQSISEEHLLLSVLSLVDITMIGNLIIMIMVGGYSIFIRKFKILADTEMPQWLEHITSGSLKVKMGMSLIGVSSIHLLKDFIDAKQVDWQFIGKHVGIHMVFIISTIALAYTDKLLHSVTEINHNNNHNNH